MASKGAQADAAGSLQFQAPPQGPNMFTTMMAAAGQGGGWDKTFGGFDDWLSGIFGGGPSAGEFGHPDFIGPGPAPN